MRNKGLGTGTFRVLAYENQPFFTPVERVVGIYPHNGPMVLVQGGATAPKTCRWGSAN